MLCASGRQPRPQGRRLPAEDEKVCYVSSPVGAIQGSILDGLAEMSWLYAYSAVQVRDRARYLQDAVMGNSDFSAYTSTPSTTAASFAFASGTASAFNPNSRA